MDTASPPLRASSNMAAAIVATLVIVAETLSVVRAEAPSGDGPRQRRQIVFIMTDTTRADMLNCYRETGLKTPSLDRLARGGMRFERAYTCQPLCSPARSAIFTGTFPHTNGVWSNCLPLGANVKTVGQRLHDKGLHTCYIGKWHLDGTDYFGDGRCPDGWDPHYWYDGRRYLEELSAQERARARDVRSNCDPGIAEEFTYGHRCSSRAIEFLATHHDEDFFLVVSYDEPHGPCLCPRSYREMYENYRFPASRNVADMLERKPAHQQLWAGERLHQDRERFAIAQPDYFGCHTFIDHEIGRVLDAIDRHAPGALVMYTSDHGDMLGSHRLTGKGPAMYEEITHIPLLVRWPGHTPAGTVCRFPVSHINIVPTILEAAGLNVPEYLQGKSMLAALKDPAVRPNDVIFMEWGRFEVDRDGVGGFQPIRAVTDGRYKLVVNLLCTDELYDLQTDPEEMVNRIDSPEHAARRNRLHDRLLRWMDDTRDPMRGYYWARRPWRPDVVVRWVDKDVLRQRADDGYEPPVINYDTGVETDPKERVRVIR